MSGWMMATTARTASDQLADLLGPEAVVDARQLPEYAIRSFTPYAAVKPTDPDAVSSVLAWATGAGAAVYPVGGRTQTDLGNPPARPGIAIDLCNLDRLVDFQPADLTITAQAGMTISGLQSILAQEGKYVPISAPLAGKATIGGTLATGLSGPLRSAYGLPRDWLIGIRVIDAAGTQTSAGGKVVKNVTGYDLNRLYTGSLGTLAIITEATFKIAPAPAEWAVIVADFTSNAEATAACRSLQSQPYAPLGLHVLNPAAAQRVAGPDLVTGYGPVAIAIIGGRPSSVRRRLTDTSLLWLDDAAMLQIRRDEAITLIEALADLPADPTDPPTVSLRINTPPAALPELLAMSARELAGTPAGIAVDVGFGGGRLLWWDDFTAADPVSIAETLRTIQADAARLGGSAVIERCPESVKQHLDVWGPLPSSMTIMRRLKSQFDPAGILNPGRFIGGL